MRSHAPILAICLLLKYASYFIQGIEFFSTLTATNCGLLVGTIHARSSKHLNQSSLFVRNSGSRSAGANRWICVEALRGSSMGANSGRSCSLSSKVG